MSSPPPSERLMVVTLVLLTTVTAVVSSLGAPLVVAIARHYEVAQTSAQWALTATMLSGAVATPILGRLGSGRLRRPTIVGGLAVVTLGSVLGTLPAFGSLVAGRALQGIGLGLVPLAIATARDVLPSAKVPSMVALLSVTVVAGAGLGYPASSVTAELGGVPAAYAAGGVLTLATLVLAWRVLPDAADTEPSPVDWRGAALLGAGMVGVLLAVSQGETWGWDSPLTLGGFAVGALLLAAWVHTSSRTPLPLVDLSLAIRPGLAAPNLVAFAAGVGMYTLLALVVVVVQAPPHDGFGLGEPTMTSGFMLVPYAVLSVLGSRMAQAVSRTVGTRVLLPAGCALFLSATLLLAFAHAHLAGIVVWMAIGGLGSGFTFSSLAFLMVPHVPPSETGSAMAFNQVLRYLGFAVGSSLSVALMEVYGGGEHGFVGSLLTMSAVWVIAGTAAWWLSRPRSTVAG